jgi:hypothetical protein
MATSVVLASEQPDVAVVGSQCVAEHRTVVTGGGSFRPEVVVLEERRQFLRPNGIPGTIATTTTNTTPKRDVANVAAVV